jgi:hypothetical protein
VQEFSLVALILWQSAQAQGQSGEDAGWPTTVILRWLWAMGRDCLIGWWCSGLVVKGPFCSPDISAWAANESANGRPPSSEAGRAEAG